MTVSMIPSSPSDLFATELDWMVHDHKPECPEKQNLVAVFKIKVTATDQNVYECLSRQYLLDCQTFCYQTWYNDASFMSQSISRKCWFAVFKLKVTVRAHITKYDCSTTSFELLILCNQTWF